MLRFPPGERAFIGDSRSLAIHMGSLKGVGMIRPLLLCAVWVLGQAALAPPSAAEPRRCLSQEQRRTALASHRAVRAGRAIAIAKKRFGGDVVRVRLCESAQGTLRYVLTVLPRDGKVRRVIVDAATGKFVSAR